MIDAGKINIARLLEPVAMLWIRLALDGISHSSFSAADVLTLVRFQKLCSRREHLAWTNGARQDLAEFFGKGFQNTATVLIEPL